MRSVRVQRRAGGEGVGVECEYEEETESDGCLRSPVIGRNLFRHGDGYEVREASDGEEGTEQRQSRRGKVVRGSFWLEMEVSIGCVRAERAWTYQTHSFTYYEDECLVCHCDGRGEEEVPDGDMEEGDRGEDRCR